VTLPVYKRSSPRLSRIICAALLLGDLFSYRCARAAPASHPTHAVKFDIPAGPAADTLTKLAAQGHTNVLYDPGEIGGITTPAIAGVFNLEQALEKLLRDTKLIYTITNGDFIAISAAKPPTSPPPLPAPPRKIPPLDVAPSMATEAVLIEADYTSFGSLSAGARPIALFDRNDIDRRDPGNLSDLLRTQSQNFAGGPAEYPTTGREAGTNSVLGSSVNLRGLDAGATMILIDGRRVAPSGSSGAFSDISNIPLSAVQKVEIMPDGATTRYGADAPGGVVNVSMRNNFVGSQVDARFGSVTDGAVQEKRYDGLWGAPLSFVDGGHIMFGFEYYRRNALAAQDRSQVTGDLGPLGANFTQTYGNPGTLVIGTQTWKIASNPTKSADAFAAGSQSNSPYSGTTILPDQKRMSVIESLRLSLDERWQGFFDALGTIRDVSAAAAASKADLFIPTTSRYYFDPTGANAEPETVQYSFLNSLGPQTLRGVVKTLNTGAGLNFDSGNWRWTGAVDFAGERELQHIGGLLNYTNLQSALDADAFDPFGFGGHTNSAILPDIGAYRDFKSSSYYYGGRLSMDGLLRRVRAGVVKVSSGLEFRRQTLNDQTSGSFAPLALAQAFGRTTESAFSEIRIPLFSPQHRITAFERLEVSAAARFDRYSDVGHALAPSFGINWSPVGGLSLQGNFSRSFRPPNLFDRAEVNNQSVVVPLRDNLAPAGVSQTLIWFGGNSQLIPESAGSWTAGLTWMPPLPLESSLALTFFDIAVHNRLNQPELASNLLDDASYEGRVTRNPTTTLRDAVCQRSVFQGGSAASCLSTPIDSILDLRLKNVSELHTRGIDFSARLEQSTFMGTVGGRLDGTYLLKYALTPNADSPATSLLNRQNNPINLRFNTEGYWKYRNLQLATLVTYANSYRNWDVSPASNIASWTTVDMSASYVIETANRSALSGITLSARVQNLFNRMPPFINNTVETVGYDQENGSVLGRFVSLSIRTQF